MQGTSKWIMLGVALIALSSGPVRAAPKAPETWTEPLTGMVFVAIPKGCFKMGSPAPVELPADTMWAEVGYTGRLSDNETPAHEACVDAFWMGRVEVTRKVWQAVMGADPAPGAPDAEQPVTRISWDQAQVFARRLGARSGDKVRFRLPTEAEWEYACLAGGKNGDPQSPEGLGKVAHFGLGNSDLSWTARRIDRVGQRQANAFGLQDMLGNAWEWVADSYLVDGYAGHALYNPRVEANTDQRGIRGGSFRTEYAQVRCAHRSHQSATGALETVGFRLVRDR
jgi:formylglycine-generating enzyme required for sulfatase activity